MEAFIVFPESTCRKCDGELSFCQMKDKNGNWHVRIWCAPCYALWPQSVTGSMRSEYGVTDWEALPLYRTKAERGLVDTVKAEARKQAKEEKREKYRGKQKAQAKFREDREYLASRIQPAKSVDVDAEIQRLRKMPYADYLRTAHWKRKRQEALKAAVYRCQTCYASEELQVHHRTYARRGCEKISDLTVLCVDCHLLFHEKREGKIF